MPRFPPHPERRPAVVTGASSGIGRATATALAEAGHPVVLGARRVEVCEQVAADIRAAGGQVLALPLDLDDEESTAEFARRACELGPVEVLVNNAGAIRPATAVEATPGEFLSQLTVNLLGPQRLLHHLVPGMVQRARGDVVFVTSEVSQRPRPHMAAYVASKSGLESLADTMRMELEGSGVRVSVVRPGPAATGQGADWTGEQIDTVMRAWTHWGLMRHAGYLRPADVAAAVVSVVSVPRGTQITHLEIQPEAPPHEPEDRTS